MSDAPVLAAARAAFDQREFDRALALLTPALAAPPVDDATLSLAANAALQAGQLDRAIPMLEDLVRRRPEQDQLRRVLSQAHNRAGSLLRKQQRDAAAERAFVAALQAWPDNPDALFNLGLLYGDSRAHASALPLWERLHRLNPDDAEATVELAASLALNDRPARAREILDRLAWRPQLGDAHGLRLAEALALTDQPEASVDLIGRLNLTPAAEPRLLDLGDLLARASVVPAAQAAYRRAWSLREEGRVSPGLLGRFGAGLALPSVYRDASEILQHRQRWCDGVAAIDEELNEPRVQRCEHRLVQLAWWGNFYLAYQGLDDRGPQSAYGDLLARLAPKFAPSQVRTRRSRRRSGPTRIGLVSSSFRDCTAGHYFASWTRLLAAAGHAVEVFQLGPAFDHMTEQVSRHATELHRVEESLDQLAIRLADRQCDLLIYPELGMDGRLLPLAALRLAPRQACAWGHPVTSGLPTIDAFFSCAEMEPADADDHYRERLLLLPGLGTDYRPPPVPPAASRLQLGLPEGRRLYFVPHSLFKLHPDNDAVLARVALSDPQATLVLFQGEGRGTLAPFRRRLEAALVGAGANPAAQLLFLPMGSRERFLQINRACDVMVDALHWSGGNTSIDALVSGLPLVTCPGRFMRGRQSAAMLRRLGLPELIVDRSDALADVAVAVATDPARRDALSRQILDQLPQLFDAQGVGNTLATHVDHLLAASD